MLSILEESDGMVLGVRVNGKITKTAFQVIADRSELIIDEYGRVRVLLYIQSLGSIEPAAFWADLKFSLRHLAHLDRLAIVGDARWQAPSASLIKPFVPAAVRHYASKDIEKAWKWLFEGNLGTLKPLRVNDPAPPLRAKRPLHA